MRSEEETRGAVSRSRHRWHGPLLILIAILAGVSAGLNASARWDTISATQIWTRVLLGAALATIAVFVLDAATRRLVQILDLPPETRERYLKYDPLTATVFLVTLLGASGFQLLAPVTFAAVIACLGLKAVLLYSVMPPGERARVLTSLGWLAFLFLNSGVAALIYQIVWQRVLFAAFGINIESITIVVSIFMFGLGLGSILGGLVARKYSGKLIGLFVTCEMCVGLFGIVSLPLIAAVSGTTLHGSLLAVSVAVFALLCIPTLLMGATLPILVSHLFQRYKNLGKTVGLLYCINTLGSAIACFLTADVLFVLLGEQASVMVAVACNWTVAALVIQYARRTRRAAIEQATAADGVAPYGGNSQSLPGRE